MANTNTPGGEENADRRDQENVDRRKGDRRQTKEPYTGPERRKHERREQ